MQGQQLYKPQHCLSLNGELLTDLAIVPRFVQETLGGDPAELHDELTQGISSYADDERISRGALRRVQGSHPALQYRGRPIWRSKVWLQTDFEQGLRRYYYTGWSWAIADATAPFGACPQLDGVLTKVNNLLPAKQAW